MELLVCLYLIWFLFTPSETIRATFGSLYNFLDHYWQPLILSFKWLLLKNDEGEDDNAWTTMQQCTRLCLSASEVWTCHALLRDVLEAFTDSGLAPLDNFPWRAFHLVTSEAAILWALWSDQDAVLRYEKSSVAPNREGNNRETLLSSEAAPYFVVGVCLCLLITLSVIFAVENQADAILLKIAQCLQCLHVAAILLGGSATAEERLVLDSSSHLLHRLYLDALWRRRILALASAPLTLRLLLSLAARGAVSALRANRYLWETRCSWIDFSARVLIKRRTAFV